MSGAWQILGLSMHSPEIEHGTLEEANGELADYGIAITRLGNLDINLDDDDNARLKKLAGDTAYSRLAGSFTAGGPGRDDAGRWPGHGPGRRGGEPGVPRRRPRAWRQMMGAPQQAPAYPPPPAPGFAGGGQGYAPPAAPAAQPAAGAAAAPPPPPAGTVQCSNCQSQVREGAKFCDSCGNPMAKHCTNCNASLSPTVQVLRRVRHSD